MKKSLLLVCVMGSSVFAFAQNQKHVQKMPDLHICEPTAPSTAVYTPAERKTPLVVVNTAVTDVTLGCSNNLYGGFTRPGRPVLDYAKVGANGVITVIHRSGPGCTPSDGTAGSGYLMIDVSKDGGTTFNPAPSLGPVGDFGANAARYPMAVVYNPSGNTVADSAFCSYLAPGLTGAAAPWRAHHTGAAPVGDPTNFRQTTDLFDSTVTWTGLLPDAMDMDGSGTTWAIDLGQAQGFSEDFDDTIIVRKGTWSTSARQHVYTTSLIPFPVIVDTAQVGHYAVSSNIAANGNTVYFSVLGCADLAHAPDTSFYITVWKSTNGGSSWSAPLKISRDVNTQMGTTGVKYSTAFQIDGAVDSQGKYHMIVNYAVSSGGGSGSINTAPGTHGMFSVITDGSAVTQTLLAKPLTFRGTFGAISDDSRGQIALSPNRDKVIYVWFDTDTTAFPGGANSNPNAIARMYDVASASFDGVTQLTAGSAADGLMTFGYVANFASQGTSGCGANAYNVHLGYQAPTGTDTQPGIFHYVGGACITGVKDAENVVFNIGEVYPNPSSGLINIELTMKKSDKVNIEVSNLLGQVVYTDSKTLVAGDHTMTLDATEFNSGIYFYTVKSAEFSITKKIVRE